MRRRAALAGWLLLVLQTCAENRTGRQLLVRDEAHLERALKKKPRRIKVGAGLPWAKKARSSPRPSPRPTPAAPAFGDAPPGSAATYARYHGMFHCTVGSPCPSYSASFLASKAQLLDNPVTPQKMRRKNTNMETASYHSMGSGGAYDVWRTVDALDYAVEHLSMREPAFESHLQPDFDVIACDHRYERMIHSQKTGADKASAIGDAVYGAFVDRLAAYEKRLKEKCGGDDPALRSQARDTDALKTVGVMPLYAAGHARVGRGGQDSLHGGQRPPRYESKALYLNITIRSVRCHFGAVAVSRSTRATAYLERGGPARHRRRPWVDPDHLPVNKPSFLGVATVRAIQRRWTNETTPLWDQLAYVHYTEADQVVHDFEPLRAAFDAPSYGHNLPEDPGDELFADLERRAAALRRDRYGLKDDYAPKRDFWHRNLFGETSRAGGGWVRSELEGYGAKRMLSVGDDLRDGSCCYLKRGETEYPATGGAGGVASTVQGRRLRVAPVQRQSVDRDSPVELLALGDHGLGILAALCCHICARKSKLGRHCDNCCVHAKPGDEDCAVGAFADPA
ncbi:hypothetical protein JL721_11416 [Aureococcus anophagefferens]|nr:hypothetical protein JL721_11416 [Aureococcus anophagefferens]